MASAEYTATTINELWRPGMSLDAHYPVATGEQIADAFTQHLGTSAFALEGVLGAIRQPDKSEGIKGIASIDLCEVVRSTARSMSTVCGKDYLGNNYRLGLWEDERFLGETENPHLHNTLQPIIQVMMNHDYITPVEGIEEIADITTRWRQNLGVYCVANTSTLSGCELATVGFVNKHMPESFDGIVFPRNHNGRGKITKSKALTEVIDQLALQGQDIDYAIHVDDTEHHHRAMLDTPPHVQTHVFLPEHPDNMPVKLGDAANVTRSLSPVESFRAMDEYIRQQD